MKYLSLTIPGYGKIDAPTGLPTGTPTGGLETNVIQTFIVLAVVLAVITSLWFILKSGLGIIMSGGVKEKLKSSRDALYYAIFGLFMLFLSFFLLNLLGAALGYNFLCIVFNFSSCNL